MKVNSFKKLVKECFAEVKRENDPRIQLKESLRGIVKTVLTEMANVNKPEADKEEKEKIDKGYNKKGNERLDKPNNDLKDELETIVHGINKEWKVYWDDHNELNVMARNQLHVRISPKFENNYDIDAMVKLVDRIRAIALTWEQVKKFVKANFSDLDGKTIPDRKHQMSIDNGKADPKNDGKDAGPRHDIMKLRTGNVKDTKRDDKMYNEPAVTKDEDMPSAPMRDAKLDDKNKNIKKTDKVKAPKHKNDNDLKTSLNKTKKFTEKNK